MILIKHTLRVFIALSVVISCVFSGFVTANADEVKTQNTTNSIIQNADNKESYSAYLQKYSKSDYADTQVVHKLSGAVLDAQPIEFNIKVEKDGLYGIGMSYKALETQMSSVRIGLKIDGKYHINGTETRLNKECYDAFLKMFEAAKAAGDEYAFKLKSAYRSYDTQVSTYNYWVSQDGKETAEKCNPCLLFPARMI